MINNDFNETITQTDNKGFLLPNEQALEQFRKYFVQSAKSQGRIGKFYGESCLLEQEFIKDPDKTVQQVLTEKIASIGENISIRRFVRFERGEGIEKKEENFAEEVMKQING